jgi:hypothetical protein
VGSFFREWFFLWVVELSLSFRGLSLGLKSLKVDVELVLTFLCRWNDQELGAFQE